MLAPDLEHYLETYRHVEAVGWIVDPTTYPDRQELREDPRVVAEALFTAHRKIAARVAERLQEQVRRGGLPLAREDATA